MAVDGQVEVREVAGVAVVDALRAAGARQRVAVVVEDAKGVAVLHASAAGAPAARRSPG